MAINLGNVVGLIASTAAPVKKYIWWFHILDAAYPNEGILKRWDEVSGSWIRAEDSFWLGAVNGINQTAPPGSPAVGDSYLIASSGTSGAFVGKENQHALWLGHSWTYTVPKTGSRGSSKSSSSATYYFTGSAWTTVSIAGITGATNGLSISGSNVKFGGTPLTEAVQLNINSSGGGALQFLDGGDILADIASRRLYFDTAEISVDWDTGHLNNVGGDVRLDWLGGYAYDGSGQYSVNWFDHQLHAFNGLSVDYDFRQLMAIDSFLSAPAIDWQYRYAYADNGNRTIHWNTCELRDYTDSNLSVDWGSRVLHLSDGTASIRWADHTLLSSSSDVTLQWQDGFLFDAAGNHSVEWAYRYLITSGGAYVVDWENGAMADASDVNAFNWFSRIIYDTAGLQSVRGNARQLVDELGSTAIQWSDSNRFIYGVWTWANSAGLAGEMNMYGRINLQSWESYVPANVNSNTDYSGRLTISAFQQANHDYPNGDAIRIIEEHASAKGGIKWYSAGKPAQVVSTNAEPFAVTTGQTLILSVSGGASITVTFTPAISGAATASELSDAITKAINYTNPAGPTGLVDPQYWGQCVPYILQSGTNRPDDPLYIAIRSAVLGLGGNVNITGGTARAALGFSIATTTGTSGTTTLTGGRSVEQMAWLIAHHLPNNPASNNDHYHLSVELPDASGEMQTRVSWEMYRDVARMMVSSAMLVLDTYPLTISASANSNKSIYFSRDNTARDISRVFELQVKGDTADGGNLGIRAFSDAGVVTELLTFNRLGKYMAANGAMEWKIRSTANTAATTMTLSPQNGNSFQLSGTGTVQYIANTDWQAGSLMLIKLQGAATLTHNAGSPTSTNRPLKLRGGVNYTAGTNGSIHVFQYDGSGYSNVWEEVSRSSVDPVMAIGQFTFIESPSGVLRLQKAGVDMATWGE